MENSYSRFQYLQSNNIWPDAAAFFFERANVPADEILCNRRILARFANKTIEGSCI